MTDKLREALEWYAEQVSACIKITPKGDEARLSLDKDRGERARVALAAAPQPAPVDRHEMARVILTAPMGAVWAETVSNIVDALLARGLRLPGGDETMAWAVVDDEGFLDVPSIHPNWDHVADDLRHGESFKSIHRVAIRVVEGGDDAA